MNKKYIIVFTLLVYTLLIMLPPLMYGYVYPNNGDDSAYHIVYFTGIRDGVEVTADYLGQNIVGYPLIWVSNITGVRIATLFLWFNFIVLWLVGVSTFVLIAKYIDWKAGLLAILMVVFVTPSTLNLFDTGAIYDLATVGVILPLFLYCGLQLWSSRKWYWIIPVTVLLLLGMSFHTMGILDVIAIGGTDVTGGESEVAVPTLAEFAGILLGYVVLVMLGGLITYLVFKYKALKIDRNVQILVGGLFIIATVMAVLVFTSAIGWSLRIAIDLAIVLAIISACLLGIVIKTVRRRLTTLVACVLVIGSSIPLMSEYLHYNSAVKPIDMEAIAYVNSLAGEYYSCSPEVAPWIYGSFLNKEYKEGELPYISRNVPMTSMTSPDTRYYWRKDLEKPNHPLDDAVKFKKGEVEISVVLP